MTTRQGAGVGTGGQFPPLPAMSFAELEKSLRELFNHPDYSGDAAMRLLALRQANHSVADFGVLDLCGGLGVE